MAQKHTHNPAAYDQLRTEHGDRAMAVMNACAQHRMGRPYDPWDWQTVTDRDIDMARELLGLLR